MPGWELLNSERGPWKWADPHKLLRILAVNVSGFSGVPDLSSERMELRPSLHASVKPDALANTFRFSGPSSPTIDATARPTRGRHALHVAWKKGPEGNT